MSLSFKNLKTVVNGQDYYAESVDISESISIETFSALGTKSSYAFPSNKPEGSINMTFYVTTGDELSNIESQYAKSDFISISVGPFEVSHALLNSFSVQGDPGNIIKGSASFNYYGQMVSGSTTPSKSSANIVPAHGAASSGDFSEIGVEDVMNFNYSFSQSHEVQYEIGSSAPSKVIFNDANRDVSLSILASDANFPQSNLTGVGLLCNGNPGDPGFSRKDITLSLNNLCEENIGTLYVSGYIQERSITAEPGQEAIETIKITEKYVREANCDE